MDPSGRRRSRSALAWLGLAALATLLGTGHFTVAAAAWIAPLALLRFARALRPRVALLLGAPVVGAAAFVASRGFIPAPLPFELLFGLVIGLAQLTPVVLHRLIAPRLRPLLATLVYPAAATALEHLGQRAQPFGSWGAWGYTQVGFPAAAQVVTLFGLPGLTWIMAWSAATVDSLLERGAGSRARLLGLIVPALLVGAGAIRVATFAPSAPSVRVALVDSPRHAELERALAPLWTTGANFDFAPVLALAPSLNDDLIARTRAAATGGAQLVVWPEASAFVSAHDEPALRERLAEMARASGAMIAATTTTVLDAPSGDNKRIENTLLLFGGDGALLTSYRKAIAVPGVEAEITRTGDGRIAIVNTPLGRVALAICFDLDFPSLVREAGRRGAVLLIAPSEDWAAIDPWHARMASFRAIENGLTLVRPARHGRWTVVDPLGRTIAELDDARVRAGSGELSLVASAPAQHRATLYPLIGDAVAWIALALLLCCAIIAVARPQLPGDPMKRTLFLSIGALLVAGSALAGDGGLKFDFADLKSDQGRVRCGLYASEADFLKKPLREADGAIHDRRARCEFAGVPAGSYALAAWHDANDNGKLDTNFLGIPNEGLGWSNNARGSMGPAKWKDAVFKYDGGALSQTLKIRY